MEGTGRGVRYHEDAPERSNGVYKSPEVPLPDWGGCGEGEGRLRKGEELVRRLL